MFSRDVLMARRRAFPAAILAGLVLAHVVGAFAFRSWAGSSTYWADPSRYVIWTLTLGQCGLLAWWVGVTRVRPVWKLAGWCTAIDASSAEHVPMWRLSPGLCCLAAAVGFGLLGPHAAADHRTV